VIRIERGIGVDCENLLIVQSGLDIQANLAPGLNGQTVKDGNVDVRCQQRTEQEARTLSDAVTNNANGALPWIKARWLRKR